MGSFLKVLLIREPYYVGDPKRDPVALAVNPVKGTLEGVP